MFYVSGPLLVVQQNKQSKPVTYKQKKKKSKPVIHMDEDAKYLICAYISITVYIHMFYFFLFC